MEADMNDTNARARPIWPLVLPLFVDGPNSWDDIYREMRELWGDDAWDDALAQCELDMQDATVSAPAGLHW